MRKREFLTEASIFSKPKQYTYGHKVRVSTSAKGESLLTAIQQVIPEFDPSEDLEWVETFGKKDPILIRFGKSDEYKIFKRANGDYLAISGSNSALQGALNHAPGQKGSTEKNVGDLSEPVLSAAVVAKLIKRGTDSIEDITDQDVIDTLNAAISNAKSSYTVRDKNSKIADIIHFTVSVREPTKIFMQSPGFWETYGKLLPSAVHYANSGQIDRYADYFYKNGRVDAIWVKSDGMSDQRSKKTDIEAYVKDASGNIRLLRNLKISLKAGSSQFGQMGAGTLTSDVTSAKGVYVTASNFFGPLGVVLPQPKKITEKVTYWTQAYKTAAKQLKTALAGDDAKAEAGIVSKIANLVVYHATKGDETVRLVQLSKKGVSTIHSFSNLAAKLQRDNIDLDVSYREGVSNSGEPRPEINIYDKNSKKSLIKMGYHATGDNTKIWNAITMEPLLAELTTYTPIKKTTPSAPPVQPAAQAAPAQSTTPEPVELGPDELDQEI